MNGGKIYSRLVVWNMNFMIFHILGIIIPTDELIFFRGVETTNQYKYMFIPVIPIRTY